MRKWMMIALLLAGTGLVMNAAWIPVKAQLAQLLLQNAWHKNLAAGETVNKPWPWADTRPVARLLVKNPQQDLIILSGNTGNSMAFAPGLLRSAQLPSYTVISAHRDTHFRFLQFLRHGDLMCLQQPALPDVHYVVEESRVIDIRHALTLVDDQQQRLLLITCYPFNAIQPGGNQRYVVIARASKQEAASCADIQLKGESHV